MKSYWFTYVISKVCVFHVFAEVFADLFVVFLSLIGDLNHKFKLIPRVPKIIGFSIPGGSNIFEDDALGYSFSGSI